MTNLRQRTTWQTGWQTPACESCQQYGIELSRTARGYALWEQGVSIEDIRQQIEAQIIACDHSPEGDWLQDASPAERRAAGLRPSIRVHTRQRPVYGPDGALLANGSAWTDEGVYVA